MTLEKRACHGADTTPTSMGDMGHGQQCQHCGRKVRDGYEDHPLFGFRQCVERYKSVARPEQKGGA